jgi:hypothetical protein
MRSKPLRRRTPLEQKFYNAYMQIFLYSYVLALLGLPVAVLCMVTGGGGDARIGVFLGVIWLGLLGAFL